MGRTIPSARTRGRPQNDQNRRRRAQIGGIDAGLAPHVEIGLIGAWQQRREPRVDTRPEMTQHILQRPLDVHEVVNEHPLDREASAAAAGGSKVTQV